MKPRVLYVSKPIVPPWHDGSKNLVRDLARYVRAVAPRVLVDDRPGRAEALAAPQAALDRVYSTAGGFSPGIMQNARVLKHLLEDRDAELLHFVFAPNTASSGAAHAALLARRLRGRRVPVVQTIASRPREWESVAKLLFGDTVIALSEWSKRQLLQHAPKAKVVVIPPSAPVPPTISAEERRALRRRYGLGDGPIVLYPGDYEVSSGADTVARATGKLHALRKEISVVFACRPKTPRAAEARAAIEAKLVADGVASATHHLGTVDDMAALLQAVDVVAFPVDDLYGKVDLPLVLLEALAVGTPVIVAAGGPLEELVGARVIPPRDPQALAEAVLGALAADDEAAREARRSAYRSNYTPEAVAAKHDALYLEMLKR